MMHGHDATVTQIGQTLALEMAYHVFMQDSVCNPRPHCQTQLKPTHWTFKKTQTNYDLGSDLNVTTTTCCLFIC